MINELVALAKERYAVMSDLRDRFELLETEDFTTCESNPVRECDVHVNSGLQILADECGATITTESRGSDTFPWEHSFDYDGVHFFEIATMKELK